MNTDWYSHWRIPMVCDECPAAHVRGGDGDRSKTVSIQGTSADCEPPGSVDFTWCFSSKRKDHKRPSTGLESLFPPKLYFRFWRVNLHLFWCVPWNLECKLSNSKQRNCTHSPRAEAEPSHIQVMGWADQLRHLQGSQAGVKEAGPRPVAKLTGWWPVIYMCHSHSEKRCFRNWVWWDILCVLMHVIRNGCRSTVRDGKCIAIPPLAWSMCICAYIHPSNQLRSVQDGPLLGCVWFPRMNCQLMRRWCLQGRHVETPLGYLRTVSSYRQFYSSGITLACIQDYSRLNFTRFLRVST